MAGLNYYMLHTVLNPNADALKDIGPDGRIEACCTCNNGTFRSLHSSRLELQQQGIHEGGLFVIRSMHGRA
jgi:hypothetical protein